MKKTELEEKNKLTPEQVRKLAHLLFPEEMSQFKESQKQLITEATLAACLDDKELLVRFACASLSGGLSNDISVDSVKIASYAFCDAVAMLAEYKRRVKEMEK